MDSGSSNEEVSKRERNNKENCRTIINNSDMIMMLRDLSKKGNSRTVSITRSVFEGMVNERAESLLETDKVALLKEKEAILGCVDSGTTEFDIDKPSYNGSSNGIALTIIITSAGGRRSKTRRAKKGKRKETKRRRRGHRRF
jgi:hypothetical protein